MSFDGELPFLVDQDHEIELFENNTTQAGRSDIVISATMLNSSGVRETIPVQTHFFTGDGTNLVFTVANTPSNYDVPGTTAEDFSFNTGVTDDSLGTASSQIASRTTANNKAVITLNSGNAPASDARVAIPQFRALLPSDASARYVFLFRMISQFAATQTLSFRPTFLV